tara:strand:+ start:86 stop:775 length:690 start_codon:yes stop_codon:yes gene_type:complete
MKNIVYLLGSLIVLIFLSNCTPHQFSGGAAHKCYGWFGERIPGCVDDRPGYNSDGSYSSSSSSSNSSSSYSSSDFRPVLFYDSSTGGMRECAYDPGSTGVCNSFKAFNAKAYNNQTLFYNPSTGSMQPCIGSVTYQGKCSSYGLYRNGLASNNQLFYDTNSNKMTTCRHVSATGSCLAFDLVPKKGSTSSSYIVDDPSNPYKKNVPEGDDLIKLGEKMLSGSCTLGLDC